jgi:hypothetical protein
MDVFRIRKIRDSSSTSTAGTLDSLHQDIVQNLRETKVKQESLLAERTSLREQISQLYAQNDLAAIVQANKLEARVRAIDQELEQTNPVEDYYLKTMDILNEYYKPAVGSQTLAPKESNTFLKYFQAATVADTGPTRKQMYDEYVQRMRLSAGPEIVQQMTEHCTACNTAKEEVTSEGILVCPRCGAEEYTLVVSDVPSFRDPPKERNNYAYKKINHLNEILNQFQAKESTIIPEDVMNEVVLEVKKRRIANIADLTEEDIRQILKKLNRSKYYEHRAHILSRLNGNPPPTITPEIEEKIRTMFQEIQAPFLLYCPDDRTNFLSYSYILYKFFELLELDEYKVYFPLLKSRDRLIAHDQIWKKICDYLQWEFIRSV